MSRIEVKAAEMKQYVCLETLDVPIAIGFLDQGLDLIIEPFDGTIGDLVSKVCQDVRKMSLALTSQLLNRFQA